MYSILVGLLASLSTVSSLTLGPRTPTLNDSDNLPLSEDAAADTNLTLGATLYVPSTQAFIGVVQNAYDQVLRRKKYAIEDIYQVRISFAELSYMRRAVILAHRDDGSADGRIGDATRDYYLSRDWTITSGGGRMPADRLKLVRSALEDSPIKPNEAFRRASKWALVRRLNIHYAITVVHLRPRILAPIDQHYYLFTTLQNKKEGPPIAVGAIDGVPRDASKYAPSGPPAS